MQSLLAKALYNGAIFVGRTKFVSAKAIARGFEVILNSQGEHLKLT